MTCDSRNSLTGKEKFNILNLKKKKPKQVIIVLSNLEILTENHNSNIVQTECLLSERFYQHLSQHLKGIREWFILVVSAVAELPAGGVRLMQCLTHYSVLPKLFLISCLCCSVSFLCLEQPVMFRGLFEKALFHIMKISS